MHFFSYKTLCCKTWCQDKCNIHLHFQNLERALHVGSFPFGVDSYRDEEMFEGYGPGNGNGGGATTTSTTTTTRIAQN